jgi:hypothetical protein
VTNPSKREIMALVGGYSYVAKSAIPIPILKDSLFILSKLL